MAVFTKSLRKHIFVHPGDQQKLHAAVKSALLMDKKKFSDNLGGALLDVSNIKVVGDRYLVVHGYLSMEVLADFKVFAPSRGMTLAGIINKVNRGHFSCLVMNLFNASLRMSEEVTVTPKEGDECSFKVTDLVVDGDLLFMRGQLISVTPREMPVPSGDCQEKPVMSASSPSNDIPATVYVKKEDKDSYKGYGVLSSSKKTKKKSKAIEEKETSDVSDRKSTQPVAASSIDKQPVLIQGSEISTSPKKHKEKLDERRESLEFIASSMPEHEIDLSRVKKEPDLVDSTEFPSKREKKKKKRKKDGDTQESVSKQDSSFDGVVIKQEPKSDKSVSSKKLKLNKKQKDLEESFEIGGDLVSVKQEPDHDSSLEKQKKKKKRDSLNTPGESVSKQETSLLTPESSKKHKNKKNESKNKNLSELQESGSQSLDITESEQNGSLEQSKKEKKKHKDKASKSLDFSGDLLNLTTPIEESQENGSMERSKKDKKKRKDKGNSSVETPQESDLDSSLEFSKKSKKIKKEPVESISEDTSGMNISADHTTESDGSEFKSKKRKRESSLSEGGERKEKSKKHKNEHSDLLNNNVIKQEPFSPHKKAKNKK